MRPRSHNQQETKHDRDRRETFTGSKAYIITGPTSGTGRAPAVELAKHGTVVLVGRDRAKLDDVQKIIDHRRLHAVSVVCDLSDPVIVQRAGCAGCRAPSADCRAGQQREHHADEEADEERACLGHDVRDEPSRSVRPDRSPGAASPRRRERAVRRIRHRGPGAPGGEGHGDARRPLHLRGGQRGASGSRAGLRYRAWTPTPRGSSALSPPP